MFAVLFFLMLFTLGIGTVAAMMGSVNAIISFHIPAARNVYVTLGICTSGFLLGLIYVTPVSC